MRTLMAVALSFAVAPTLLAATPRIAFERHLRAPNDLGSIEEVLVVNAIGDTLKVDTFVELLVVQVNRSGTLRMRDGRSGGAGKADAYLAVKNFTCETKTGEAEGSTYDVNGDRVKRRLVWADAVCKARIDVSAGRQQVSFGVKGEGTSPRAVEITQEERDIALDQATKYAAVDAAEKITPRRVRESIQLDESAPSFEEGFARIDVGAFADARAIWERALRQEMRSAALHYNLAAVCEALGDHAAAEQHYLAASKLAPNEGRYASELKSFLRRSKP